MKHYREFILISLGFSTLLSGCAAQHHSASSAMPPSTRASIAPATRPVLDAQAMLTLAQIEPAPTLPATSQAVPADQAPLESLELYAKARDALATNQRFTAINLLEKAIRIDPYSAELNRTLSRAYIAGGNPAKAIDALKRAVDLSPDDLSTYIALGRLYLTRGDPASAMLYLRLALQTKAYQQDDAGAATADYFLARSLQQQGYDRAALEQYERLLKRLDHPTLAVRADPELNDWANRPETIYADVARLCEKQGDWEAALQAWKLVSQRDADDVNAATHAVNMLVNLGRSEEALRAAADGVRRSGASARSLDLLREVCRKLGNEEAAFDELRRLQSQRPGDQSLLFSLADLLASSGRDAEAESMLSKAARAGWEPEIVRKLFRFYSDRWRADAAATLLIETTAARPGDSSDLLEMFSELTRPTRRDVLRASTIARLNVPSNAEASKLYFLSNLAQAGGRDATAADAQERGLKIDPPFAPMFRLAIERIGTRSDLDSEHKVQAAQVLIDSVRARGQAGLADELLGISLRWQGKLEAAAAAYDSALKAKADGADLLLGYAALQLSLGNNSKFEQTLWRLISDHPTCEQAYIALLQYHAKDGRGMGPAALNVLQKWLQSDPSSIAARIREAEVYAESGQAQEAMRAAADLVHQNPQNVEVLIRARLIHTRALRLPQFVQTLEEMRAAAPDNVVIAEQLVDIYAAQRRLPEAARVVDAAKAAVAQEPRLLYYVAQLYNRIDRKDASQQTLEAVLKIAPDDAGANNDLGYTWADEGVNLDRAESMIRRAVESEPDNTSFLDSLGWVLYKRGRFDEARPYLTQASATEATADPVVLDHLGDTLYRLHDSAGATQQWRRSLDRLALIERQRDDLEKLRPVLELKIRQAELDQPVNVAPTLIEPAQTPATPARADGADLPGN